MCKHFFVSIDVFSLFSRRRYIYLQTKIIKQSHRIDYGEKMNEDEDMKTIEIKKTTYDRIIGLKKIGESFDKVLNKLLDHYDENIEEEVNRDWVK